MRLARRAALGAALATSVLGTVAAAPAEARPWTADYQWQGDARTGYENWTPEEGVPGSGQPIPFYRTTLGSAGAAGRGITLEPLGGRVYGNGDPKVETGGPGSIVRWPVPGASRITSATFSRLKYRNEGDGQYLRVRVTGRTDAETAESTDDYGPKYDEDSPSRTYEPPARTFTTPAGTSAETWMFTICGPDGTAPDRFACPDIPSSTGTSASVGGVRLTLDDPDDPVVDVTGTPSIDDAYVRRHRTQRLAVTVKDPSSGVARIRVQAGSSAGSGRTLVDTRVRCDPDHRTAGRGGLVCPPSASATATDPAGGQGSKPRVYTITAWDYAGNETTTTRTVRLDTTAPSKGELGGELDRLTREWSNRTGDVPATLRARDALAGVAKVELLAQRQAGGRRTVLGTATVDCSDGCRDVAQPITADLSNPGLRSDGRYRLVVRVTDRAGNARDFKATEVFKRDRTPPARTPVAPQYEPQEDGSVKVLLDPGRDQPAGSGLNDVVVRYYPAPATAADTEPDGDDDPAEDPDELPDGEDDTAFTQPTPGVSVPAAPRFVAQALEVLPQATAKDDARFRSSRRSRVLVLRDPAGIDLDRGILVARTDRATNGAPKTPAGRLPDGTAPLYPGPVGDPQFPSSPNNLRAVSAKCPSKNRCSYRFDDLARSYITIRRSPASYVLGAMKAGDILFTTRHRTPAGAKTWWSGRIQSAGKGAEASYNGCGSIAAGSRARQPEYVKTTGTSRSCGPRDKGAPRDWMSVIERVPYKLSKDPCPSAYAGVAGEKRKIDACEDRLAKIDADLAKSRQGEAEECETYRDQKRKTPAQREKCRIERRRSVYHPEFTEWGRESRITTKRDAPIYRNAFSRGFDDPVGTNIDRLEKEKTKDGMLPKGQKMRWRYITKPNAKGEQFVLGLLVGRYFEPRRPKFKGDKPPPAKYGNRFKDGLGWVFLSVDAFREPGVPPVSAEQAVCGGPADPNVRPYDENRKMPKLVCRRRQADWTLLPR